MNFLCAICKFVIRQNEDKIKVNKHKGQAVGTPLKVGVLIESICSNYATGHPLCAPFNLSGIYMALSVKRVDRPRPRGKKCIS